MILKVRGPSQSSSRLTLRMNLRRLSKSSEQTLFLTRQGPLEEHSQSPSGGEAYQKGLLYKVLTKLSNEAQEFLTARSQSSPAAAASPQPPEVTSIIKYNAPDLSAIKLKFPCSPLEFIEWSSPTKRWLKGAQAHLTFEDLINTIYTKLDYQWQTYINANLEKNGAVHLMESIFTWIEEKNQEQHPRIKRLRNCKELRKAPGDIVNYQTRVKRYREAADE